MNIIFWTGVFNPTANYRAIGPYQLAWWMRKHGFDCQVIDFIHTMTTQELVEFTEKFIALDTICIGISSTFWSDLKPKNKNWPMSRHSSISVPDIVESAMAEIRRKFPKIKFVLGGHSADFVLNESYSLFDAAIIGDAEDDFLNLVTNWKNQKTMLHSVTRGGRPFINATNRLFDIQHCGHEFAHNDCIVDGEALPLEISRGCIFKCTFCQYQHTGKTKFDYLRDFDLIGQEIEYNYNKFKTTNYYILDDTFNDSDYKIQNWKKIINQLDHKVNYTGYLRADLLSKNPSHIDIFKETGLLSAFFGIESFHQEASRLVGKGWSGRHGQQFLLDLKQQWKDDVTFYCSFIVGLPPETFLDYKTTYQWLSDHQIDCWVFKPLLITPGIRTMNSELDRNYQNYGFEYDFTQKSWKTNYLTSSQSVAISSYLNDLSQRQIKITSWRAINYHSMGISKFDLNTKKSHEHNWPDIETKKQMFVSQYKNKLAAL